MYMCTYIYIHIYTDQKIHVLSVYIQKYVSAYRFFTLQEQTKPYAPLPRSRSKV